MIYYCKFESFHVKYNEPNNSAGMGSLPDPEAGGPLHHALGEWLLSKTTNTQLVTTGPPPVIYDVTRALSLAHRVLEKFHTPEKVHTTVDRLGKAFLSLVTEPHYHANSRATDPNELSQNPWQKVTSGLTPRQEKTMSRETWTTLKFHSASKVVPYYHANGSGDNDRVLDDASHGIFGVADGVGSKNATRAAEVTLDFAHKVLLTANKPASIDEAVQLMHGVFDGARMECRRQEVEGGTTLNLSFAVDIGAKHYLVVGNIGDSAFYQADEAGVYLRTTEQLFDQLPSVIFNSISSEPNHANELSDEQLKDWVFDPKTIDPWSTLPPFSVAPKLLRDEVVVLEINSGMCFTHLSDGISGDKPNERLAPEVYGCALQLDNPEATVKYLLENSIKNDDKAVVSFFAEAT